MPDEMTARRFPLPWSFDEMMRKIALAVILLMLLTQPSYAQPFPKSERQKAEEERKKEEEKANDQAYKAMMKRLPDPNKKFDPWGGVRAPAK
jgi:hypothetical protein